MCLRLWADGARGGAAGHEFVHPPPGWTSSEPGPAVAVPRRSGCAVVVTGAIAIALEHAGRPRVESRSGLPGGTTAALGRHAWTQQLGRPPFVPAGVRKGRK